MVSSLDGTSQIVSGQGSIRQGSTLIVEQPSNKVEIPVKGSGVGSANDRSIVVHTYPSHVAGVKRQVGTMRKVVEVVKSYLSLLSESFFRLLTGVCKWIQSLKWNIIHLSFEFTQWVCELKNQHLSKTYEGIPVRPLSGAQYHVELARFSNQVADMCNAFKQINIYQEFEQLVYGGRDVTQLEEDELRELMQQLDLKELKLEDIFNSMQVENVHSRLDILVEIKQLFSRGVPDPGQFEKLRDKIHALHVLVFCTPGNLYRGDYDADNRNAVLSDQLLKLWIRMDDVHVPYIPI